MTCEWLTGFAGNESSAPGGHGAWFDVAEQRAFVGVAAHEDAGGGQLAESGDHRLEQGPGSATATPGDDQVQSHIFSLGQELQQWDEWVGAALVSDQIVVVDQDVELRSRPPGAVP
jgi:hypothetical protein